MWSTCASADLTPLERPSKIAEAVRPSLDVGVVIPEAGVLISTDNMNNLYKHPCRGRLISISIGSSKFPGSEVIGTLQFCNSNCVS